MQPCLLILYLKYLIYFGLLRLYCTKRQYNGDLLSENLVNLKSSVLEQQIKYLDPADDNFGNIRKGPSIYNVVFFWPLTAAPAPHTYPL